MQLGIAPKEAEKNRLKLRKQGRLAASIFSFISFIPFIIYFLFHFGIFSSKPMYDKALEQCVALVNTGSSTGSAFLFDDKRLLTARHVVDNLKIGDTVELVFEKAKPVPITTTARIAWKENTNYPEPQAYLRDVAVLELINPTHLPEDFPRLLIGDSDDVVTRDQVILIGYPGGLMSTTIGIISNDKIKGYELFQLDVGAWQGSSGGPLILESTGEVIGVLVAGLSAEYQGINFANKINNIKILLKQDGIILE